LWAGHALLGGDGLALCPLRWPALADSLVLDPFAVPVYLQLSQLGGALHLSGAGLCRVGAKASSPVGRRLGDPVAAASRGWERGVHDLESAGYTWLSREVPRSGQAAPPVVVRAGHNRLRIRRANS